MNLRNEAHHGTIGDGPNIYSMQKSILVVAGLDQAK